MCAHKSACGVHTGVYRQNQSALIDKCQKLDHGQTKYQNTVVANGICWDFFENLSQIQS